MIWQMTYTYKLQKLCPATEKKWGRTVKTPRVRTYIFEAWKQQKWQIIRQKFAKGLEKNLKEMLSPLKQK